ncbi:NUDIX hydrolase [Spirochaetia bacterium]|nr:NUDIX hydrolase [Spirochaetia bacterium]
MSPAKVVQDVSAAIFIKNDTVLIAKRNQSGSLPGYWEFPGGKQKPGETIFECLEREILEEFNVRCQAKSIFAETVYANEHNSIRLIGIMAELPDEAIELRVHDEYRWVEIGRMLEYRLAPADVGIAEKLRAHYTRVKYVE